MKKILAFVNIVSLIVIFASISLSTHKIFAEDKKTEQKTQQSPDTVSEFQASKDWKKLDQRTQQAWLDAIKQGDTDRRLDCFVRVEWPADDGDQSFLISKGFIVRFFSGTVASGHMKAKDMPDVAKLPFVRTIRLSKPGDKK